MEIEHHLFCILNLFSLKLSKLRRVEGRVAQTNVVEEGVEGNQRGFG
jgi:hypothetical protein